MKARTVIISSILLIISLVIYVLYRPEDTLVFRLLSLSFLAEPLVELRSFLVEQKIPNDFIVYSLPGALWVFSTTILSKNLRLKLFNLNIPLIAFPIIYGIGLELMQLTSLTDGTFDIADVSSASIAWILACLFYADGQPFKTHRKIPLPMMCVIFSYMILILADTFSF